MSLEREPARADLDYEWLRRIAGGDRSAFEAFYQQHKARIFHYLYSMVHSANAAEELTNDVMLEVWKSAGRFRGQSKPSTWVFGIAHHKALNELRRHQPQLEELRVLRDKAEAGPGPEARSLADCDRAEIGRALADLTPEHRAVLELAFYHQRSCAEIARIVGCPVNTVKTRMFYAKQRLRRVLSEPHMGSDRE